MRNLLLALVVGLAALALPTLAAGDLAGTELVPGTAVLLSQSGATSSTSTMTNIFAPSAYLDYHRFGSEPSVVVDRYVGGNDNVYSCGPLGVGSPASATSSAPRISARRGGYRCRTRSSESSSAKARAAATATWLSGR